MENPENILEMRGISKRFPGVVALADVDFDLRRGEVHVLMGANGAGKSTLMKVLSGVYPMDSGVIRLDWAEAAITSSRRARELGVAIIHQHFSQVPHLSIAENLFLGREPVRFGMVDYRTLHGNARRAMAEVGLDIDVRKKVLELGVSQRQMVEIAKALSVHSKILIMDEPTSALTKKETETLFAIIHRLKSRGMGIVYISHRIDELGDLGTRVTVMRDGRVVGTRPVAGTEMAELVKMMVGKNVRLDARKNQDPPVPVDRRREVLRVEHLNSSVGRLRDISFSLYEGEILGLFGLMGAGRTELARALFGVDAFESGTVFLNGEPVKISSPGEAVKHRLGFLTEDRLRSGLCMTMGVGHNATLPCLDDFTPGLAIDLAKERAEVGKMISELAIKTTGQAQHVQYLSGGNQQKVVFAKWIMARSQILILDDPTQGIDVNAKDEVHNFILDLTHGQKKSVLLISSELPELISLSDRILVIRDGALVAEVAPENATQEVLMGHAMPVNE